MKFEAFEITDGCHDEMGKDLIFCPKIKKHYEKRLRNFIPMTILVS